MCLLTWDDWYKLAEIYYNHYGNLKVNQRFNTSNGYDYDTHGYKLGMWLNNQRTRYKKGLLTKEQKKKLENLGVNFETTHEFRWTRMYELAKKFYEHYGHVNIKQDFRTFNGYDYNADGYRLGIWVNDQRTQYKNGQLSLERIQKLETIGIVLENVREDNWNKMYQLAEVYYRHYGHLKVPHKFNTQNGYEYSADGKRLGNWILSQRRLYIDKKLRLEYIQKLSQIGMVFEDVYDKEWDRVYNLAKAYYEHHGNLRVKQKFKTKDGYTYDENGYNLSNWLETQRMMYRQNKLLEERIKKLELIGMLFAIKRNIEQNILLCEYYGIDYDQNKSIMDSIAHKELVSKINYLTSLGIPLMINNQMHPIFSMGNINMQVRYGINLEKLLNEYSDIKDKTKKI